LLVHYKKSIPNSYAYMKREIISSTTKIIFKKSFMENIRFMNLTEKYSYGSKSNFTGKHS
jgi:hypothetical protein